MQTEKSPRPIGVTLIAILAILIGLGGLLGGLAIVGLSALVATSTLFESFSGLLAGVGLLLGVGVIIFSLIWLATGVGFLHGKGWAWILGMIFSVLSLLGAIGITALGYLLGVAGVLVWILMIFYLTRTHVKSFFGKGSTVRPPAYTPTPAFPTPSTPSFGPSMIGTPMNTITPFGTTSTPTTASVSPPSSTPTTSSTPTAMPMLNRFCTNCGATVLPGLTKCNSCGQPI